MAHYPRGRDWDSPPPEGEPAEGEPAEGEPAKGGSGGAADSLSDSTMVEDGSIASQAPPAEDTQQTIPAAEAGSIAGWTAPPAAASSGRPVPQGTAPDAVPSWPVAGAPTDTPVPGEGWVDPGAATAAAPATSSGMIGGLVRRFWILGVIAIIGIGVFVFRDRLTGGANDLAVGDCFDLPASTLQEIEEVQHHPCNEPHTAEAILIYDVPGDADEYPSEAAVLASVEENCLPAFAAYTGAEYQTQSTLDIYWLYPNLESWQNGDREISCSLFRVDEAPMSKSMKGSNPT